MAETAAGARHSVARWRNFTRASLPGAFNPLGKLASVLNTSLPKRLRLKNERLCQSAMVSGGTRGVILQNCSSYIAPRLTRIWVEPCALDSGPEEDRILTSRDPGLSEL